MNKKAWLIYGEKEAIYNKGYIEFYFQEGKKLGMEFHLIFAEKIRFGVKNHDLFLEYDKKEISYPDFVICRTIYPLLSLHLEKIGIPVFNNAMVADICNDKAKTYQYVEKAGIDMVETQFVKWEFAKVIFSELEGERVIKSVNGHGGKEVFLWPQTEKEEILAALKNKDLVIQPLVGKKHQDLRVYMIGAEVQAAVLRTAKEGFKSNFSLGGDVKLYTLSEEEKRIIDKISSLFDFGLVGLDFIIGDQGQLIFNEIEDVVGSRMLYQCSDINIVRAYLNFILGHR